MDINADVFWSHVAKQPNGCWLWTAHVRRDGYGQWMTLTGGKKRALKPHRIAWTLLRGDPGELDVTHNGPNGCGDRSCCNPYAGHGEALPRRLVRGHSRGVAA